MDENVHYMSISWLQPSLCFELQLCCRHVMTFPSTYMP